MSSRIKLPFKLGDSKKTNETEINETIRKEDFCLSEIVRYGFPYRPSTMAYDPVQKILAIGTKTGLIKIYGGAFVECSLPHPTEVDIIQLLFRINEGALISVCRDNCIHLWNLRQKKPVIANTLRFAKEKITKCLLPLGFNSKWLLVGTANGNVYVVNLDTFTLSSYKIMWNNAIGMGKSAHPGSVVDLSQNPDDPSRLYIGFSKHTPSPGNFPLGLIVCWNLQQKTSETVYTLEKGLTSLSWHHEGRQFMCSHCDGSLSVWNLKSTDKPVSINHPHSRIAKDDSHQFGPINKVVWSSTKSSAESFIIFSGGMPPQSDQNQAAGSAPPKPSSYFLTILRGSTTNVLHMDNAIVDFLLVTNSPHIADIPDPSAVVVLLDNDLVVIDLKSESYPLFESLHTLDLHESPVIFCDYITDPNSNLYQNLLRLQSKQTPKRTFSQQENPISGGKCGSTIFGYNELILTGHADGSIKFWDATGSSLLFLYKLRTNRLFDRVQTHNQSLNTSNASSKSPRTNTNMNDEQIYNVSLSYETSAFEHPFAIYAIKMCCEGKYLIAAARGGHVTLFKFTGSELEKADEGLGDLTCLEVPIPHRNMTNDMDENNPGGCNSSNVNDISPRQISDRKDFKSLLRAKMGYRRSAGYQPELVCLLSWLFTDRVPILTDISINSKYGLLIFGLENGLVVIDFLSQSILMNMATADLYGTMDPFQRASASPKRRGASNDSNEDSAASDHQNRSPSSQSSEPASSSTRFSFNLTSQSTGKHHSKPVQVPQTAAAEPKPAPFFRSKSIDSVSSGSTIDQPRQSQSTAPDSSHEERTSATTGFASTFRSLRQRLSRSSANKNEISQCHRKSPYREKENTIRNTADESSASSPDEDFNSTVFSDTSPTPSDSNHIPLKIDRSTQRLRQVQSLTTDSGVPSIIMTPPSTNNSRSSDKNDDSESSTEHSRFSKTYSSTSFTGAQLRGTCSLEYSEYMKDKAHRRKAHMVDLRKDDSSHPSCQQLTLPSPPSTTTTNPSVAEKKGQSMTDANSSVYKSTGTDLPRSSSNSSMDSIVSNESICSIQFTESFTYKNDNTISPSVWLGTSRGCVIVINLNIIYEPRNISVVPSGSVFRLSGRVIHSSFLDHKGMILSTPSEKWDTKKPKVNLNADTFTQPPDFNSSAVFPGSTVGTISTSTTTMTSTLTQYAVFCSSKQARVVALPSQVCLWKLKIEDTLGSSASNVLKADVVRINNAACLTCYLSGGRIHIYSLPSLRQLFVTSLEPMSESFRWLIGSTFIFSHRGHCLYMCSPTEIQKLTIASDIKEQISEMLCDLYSPSITMPEAPKQNFFTKIFVSNPTINSDQLFGEAAGKAPVGIARKEDVNLNMNQMRGKVDSATGAVNDTRMKLIERGQKLGELEMASKQMVDGAEEFASMSHKIMLKQKEKAEWWPFTSKKS